MSKFQLNRNRYSNTEMYTFTGIYTVSVKSLKYIFSGNSIILCIDTTKGNNTLGFFAIALVQLYSCSSFFLLVEYAMMSK